MKQIVAGTNSRTRFWSDNICDWLLSPLGKMVMLFWRRCRKFPAQPFLLRSRQNRKFQYSPSCVACWMTLGSALRPIDTWKFFDARLFQVNSFSVIVKPTKNRRTTWAPVFPYFSPIAITRGSKNANFGAFGNKSAAYGRPNGLNPVMTMSRSLQNFVIFFCVILGPTSIWLVTGLTEQLPSKRSICSLLKFDTPMLRTRPVSINFSIALYVST